MPAFPFPTDLALFIPWLAGPTAVGLIVSLLLERIPWFHVLAPNWKSIVVFLLSLLLPALSAFAQSHVTVHDLASAQIVINLLLQGLVVWTSGQLSHGVDPQRLWPVIDMVLGLLNSQGTSATNIQTGTIDWAALVKRIADIETAVAGQPEPKA